MAIPGTIKGKIVDAADYVGKFISTNGHAQQAIPAVHRLSAAGGMYLGWKGGDQIRDSVFANNQISEGEFVEKKKEEIPAPLRFMYHSIDWNPHSDAPSDQWKKILYQAMPAIGATLGTVAGSTAIFHFNGRAANFAKYSDPKTRLSMMQTDEAAQYAQAKWPLFLTSLCGGGAATSMLVWPYGFGLNAGFFPRNGNAINMLNQSGGNLGPSKALAERLAKVPFYVKSAENSLGEISKDWANILVQRVLKPLFPNNLNTASKEAEAVQVVHNDFTQAYKHFKETKKLQGEELIEAVSKHMKALMGDAGSNVYKNGEYQGIDGYVKKLRYEYKDMVPGNASPRLRKFTDRIAKATGVGTPSDYYKENYVNHRDAVEATSGIGGRSL